MPDRGEQRGPIRRYRKSGSDVKRPRRVGSDAAPRDLNAGEPSASVTPLGAPSSMGTPSPPTSTGRRTPRSVRVSVRRSGGGSGLRGAILFAVIIAVIAGAAIPALTTSGSSGSPQGVVPGAGAGPQNLGRGAGIQTTTPTTSQSATPGKSATPAPSSKPVSYLTPAGLRAGLAKIEHLGGSKKVSLVRIASDSLSASAALSGGRAREVILTPTTTIKETGPASGERPIPISEIRPIVVTRILAGMRSRFRVPASRIDYMVLSTPSGIPIQWIVFVKNAAHTGYTTTLSGRNLARLP